METEDKKIAQSEVIFQEALELFNNSDASDDKLELRIMDLFRQAARLGNTDALVLLTECKFFMEQAPEEDAELLKLFQTALENETEFEEETYQRYLWLEDKPKPTPVRDAIIERAIKGDEDAVKALGLFPVEYYDSDNIPESAAEALTKAIDTMNYSPYFIPCLANFVEYGIYLEKDEDVAQLMRKLYKPAWEWFHQKYEVEEGDAFFHDEPFLLIGSEEENEVIRKWAMKEFNRNTEFSQLIYHEIFEFNGEPVDEGNSEEYDDGNDDGNDLEWVKAVMSTPDTFDPYFDDPLKLDENDDSFAVSYDDNTDGDDKPF